MNGAGPGDNASPETQDKRRGAIQTTLGYAGMYYHARSGLYLTHYRAYDPRLGRWLSRDPIWEAGGINLYGYVGGDPVGWVDPSGQCPWCVAAALGAVTGAGVDLVIQLLVNGGNLDCIDWESVGISALSGAALSALGPTGILLGRGGARASQYGYSRMPGILNRGNIRVGWSGPKDGLDVLSLRVGRQHYDVPGIGVPSGAHPLRDGTISGGLGGGVTQAAKGSCGCNK
jgi:RHS repeat-associated protein